MVRHVISGLHYKNYYGVITTVHRTMGKSMVRHLRDPPGSVRRNNYAVVIFIMEVTGVASTSNELFNVSKYSYRTEFISYILPFAYG